VALALALGKLVAAGTLKTSPLRQMIAATSVGIVDGNILLDLAYEEDSRADVDMNVVMLATAVWSRPRPPPNACPTAGPSSAPCSTTRKRAFANCWPRNKPCWRVLANSLHKIIAVPLCWIWLATFLSVTAIAASFRITGKQRVVPARYRGSGCIIGFERARLQSCRKQPAKSRALAPEGNFVAA